MSRRSDAEFFRLIGGGVLLFCTIGVLASLSGMENEACFILPPAAFALGCLLTDAKEEE